jgi:hypothetical protein
MVAACNEPAANNNEQIEFLSGACEGFIGNSFPFTETGGERSISALSRHESVYRGSAYPDRFRNVEAESVQLAAFVRRKIRPRVFVPLFLQLPMDESFVFREDSSGASELDSQRPSTRWCDDIPAALYHRNSAAHDCTQRAVSIVEEPSAALIHWRLRRAIAEGLIGNRNN